MKNTHSDLILLSKYINGTSTPDEPIDQYRILTAASFHQIPIMVPDAQLTLLEKGILQLRTKIFEGKVKVECLQEQAEKLEFLSNNTNLIVRGDLLAIKGNLAQRTGNYTFASHLHQQATQFFFQANDHFRALRSLINGKIFSADSPVFYQFGELKVLLQEAYRFKYYDLCGHIYRGLALELFNQGDFNGARQAISSAIKNYRLLSFPEDESIAFCLSALIWLCLNNSNKAESEFQKVVIHGQRVKPYSDAVKSCFAGKKPIFPNHHPLTRANWKKIIFRKDSILNRVIELLKSKPMTRDEIIFEIWGSEALCESYCNRLYVIINRIRKENLAPIVFNGNKYEINGSK